MSALIPRRPVAATLISSSTSLTFLNLFFSRHFHATPCTSSGHSKWSTIKHDKAKNDAARNKLATKFGGQIAVAARVGGADPANNVRLAMAIENAARANVPKKLIESAIRRGAGLEKDAAGAKPSELAVYEGLGPAGVAFVVEALTDNKSRTVSQVKAAFSKAQGSMAPTAYMFRKQGWVECAPKPGQESADDAFDELADIPGVEDISSRAAEEGEIDDNNNNNSSNSQIMLVVTAQVADTARVAEGIKAAGYTMKDMGIEYAPNDDAAIVEADLDEEVRTAIGKLAGALDDLDDVIEIYTNLV
ncbi:uncharacterized protein SAPINGB_P000509 [Magnusiomyces paraingens]|uniref:Transcriptional regulatory protein n=1 Tax=Magnusiomyces paraingens TaxID=2606893 RepID=A0A5E8B0B9_9ASCO|nr:uncharacterized protein SAPINGB_P000509 [Saprochaete ingens]VVT44717.1 unnamed protein product [Saprochaete ingens]